MKAENQKRTLIALLRGHAPSPPLTGDEWAALIRLATQNFVVASVWENIRDLGIELPFIAGRRLLRAERNHAAASFRNVLALEELLQAMAEAGVRVAPLKGPVLLERLYGNALRRPCADLDLLIPTAEIARAEAVFVSLGYEQELLGEPHKWTWNRGAVKVEVHGELEERMVLPLAMSAVWERTRPGTFREQPIWLLHPADELVFLSLHAVRHGLHRLSWMVELGRAFDVLSPEIGPTFPAWYRMPVVPAVVLLAQMLAERLLGKPRAPMQIFVAANVEQRIPAIADRIWEDMMQERPSPRTRLGVYRFMVELEPNLTGRVKSLGKQLWLTTERISIADQALAESLGVRSRWGTWCVRQLRLLGLSVKYAGRG